MVGDAPIIARQNWAAARQAHQRIAIRRHKLRFSFEHFFREEAHHLWRHRRTTAKNALNTKARKRRALRHGFKNLWRSEQRMNIFSVSQNDDRLIDDVLFVRFSLGVLAFAN